MNSYRGVQEPEQQCSHAWKRDAGSWLAVTRKQDNDWLQDALLAGSVLAFQWDARTRKSQRSASAAEILGFGSDEAVTAERFLNHIHPDDRRLLNASMRNIRPDNPTYTISFRFVRPDGRQIWLEETSRAEFDAAGSLLQVRGLTRDISLRRRLDEHQALLLTEFDHRMKNLLSRVAAVVSATREQSTSVDEYANALKGRIASLVDAHVLMGQRGAVSLSELTRRHLAPFTTAGNSTLTGPTVALSQEAGEAMAMILHELVTNAAKYGALSVTGGHVMVEWHWNPDVTLSIIWREVGGPTISDQLKPSYGISLVRDLIPHELAGTVEFRYAPSGVSCTICIPAEHVRDGPNAPPPRGND
jgi:PAS domain S-box-containing protein